MILFFTCIFLFLILFILFNILLEIRDTSEKFDSESKIKVCCNHDEENGNRGLIDMFSQYLPKNKKILISGSFIDSDEKVEKIRSFKGLKILFVSEPIEWFFKPGYELYQKGMFDIVIGCVSNMITLNPHRNKIIKHIKYPIYLFSPLLSSSSVFEDVNRMVKEVKEDDLSKKKFCSLINTHDRGNTRTGIYKKLLQIGDITCPSKLFNNVSNEELNRVGKVEYGKKFIFSICPENVDVKDASLKGYVTEKIMDACLSGCIPIYFGKMDEVDLRIFNKNRILFYNPSDQGSVQKVFDKVKSLMNNREELLTFYKQEVFLNTATETVEMIKNNLKYQLELLH